MIVNFSDQAIETLGTYFENYKITNTGTDLISRAYHYSRMRMYFTFFDAYIGQAYVKYGKNCLDIDNICRVEFAKNGNFILIEDIVFY